MRAGRLLQPGYQPISRYNVVPPISFFSIGIVFIDLVLSLVYNVPSQVAVRVRPENEREKAGAFSNVINVIDEKMLLFDPNEEEDPFFYHGKKQGRRDLNKRVRKNQNFAFDVVYNQASTNAQVFEGTTKDLVETVISGYNCSVFAYGATGAGKTFTMLGSKVIIYFQ